MMLVRVLRESPEGRPEAQRVATGLTLGTTVLRVGGASSSDTAV